MAGIASLPTGMFSSTIVDPLVNTGISALPIVDPNHGAFTSTVVDPRSVASTTVLPSGIETLVPITSATYPTAVKPVTTTTSAPATTLTSTPVAAASPSEYAALINQAYGTLGRTGIGTGENQIDQAGYDYWLNQLNTGALNPQTFQNAFNTAAEKNYITSAYQDIFNRAPDEAGLTNWMNTLNSVDKNTIYNAILGGAQGADLLGAEKYNTGAISDASIQKFMQDEADVLDEYEAFRRYSIDPTKAGQDYFNNVSDLYGSYLDTTFDSVFGSGAAAKLPAETKQTLLNNLLTGDATREETLASLQNSGLNKQQEATRIASAYSSLFGGTQDDAAALYAALTGDSYSGPGKVDQALLDKLKSSFNTSLTDEKAGIESLVKAAAMQPGAENTEFFKNNPTALAMYRPVGETVQFPNGGSGGQYGYLNGKPILKASEVDQLFNQMGTDYIQGDAAGQLDNDMGWDPGSLSAIEARGAAAFGIQKQPVTQWGGEDYGNVPTGEYTYTGDMNAVAQQLGIDPTKYTSQDALYDAINEKTKDFVFIAGKSGYQAGGIGNTIDGQIQTPGFTDATSNHVAQMYQRVGDKYLPVGDAKYFNAGMELSPGSWFSDTFGGIASIPGIAELSLLTPAAAFYPAIKAAQTAALGGDFGDMLKSGAIAYAGQNVLPGATKGLSEGLTNAGITGIANSALTGAITSGGISGLLGGDILNSALMGGIGGTAAGTVNALNAPDALSSALDIDPKYAKIFTNTLARLAPTLLTGGTVDPTKLLASMAMSGFKGSGMNTTGAVTP